MKIEYQFVPVPLYLFSCLDGNCRNVLFSLIQLSSVYADDDGWFFRSNPDLEAEAKLSRRVLDGALDTLFKKGIIDIIPQEKGRTQSQQSRKYRVCFDKFLDYERLKLEDCYKNPDYYIETSDYKHGVPSFQNLERPRHQPDTTTPTLPITPTAGKSRNNIDNTNNTKEIDNKGAGTISFSGSKVKPEEPQQKLQYGRATTIIDKVKEEFQEAMDVLLRYDQERKPFDDFSRKALEQATTSVQLLKSCSFEQARSIVQSERRKRCPSTGKGYYGSHPANYS